MFVNFVFENYVLVGIRVGIYKVYVKLSPILCIFDSVI